MKTIKINNHLIKLSHLDKVLFPKDGITKGELIEYYQQVALVMLPHLKNRLLTLQRFPDGIAADGFYQREMDDYYPSWIKRHTYPDKGGGQTTAIIVNNAASLIYLANQDVITFHAWLSCMPRLNFPDRMVFDLDPSDGNFDAARRAALLLASIIRDLGLTPFVQVTGSNGAHVVVPVVAKYSFDEIRSFARELAERIILQNPRLCTLEPHKDKRGNRVYLDILRNSFAQSMVAPYSVRALPGAPVATPLAWDEIGDDGSLTPQKYTIHNIMRRLARRSDPWQDLTKAARPLK